MREGLLNIDPELGPVLDGLPATDAFADLEVARADAREMFRGVAIEDPRMGFEDALIGGPDGNQLPVRIYRPAHAARPTPAAVWFHGGAFALGDLNTEDHHCRRLCTLGMTVVSVDYRLAPEHPFPAGIEDCYTAVCWTASHSQELAADARRMAVGGHSAGGGLAAAVALMARDRGHPPLRFQFLGTPALDDRVDTPSAREYVDPRIWNRKGCLDMWNAYIGIERTAVSPYAAPSRAADLSGLPPAYVLTVEIDPLCDEGLDYARRLIWAGVPTEIHHVPGAFHSFDDYAPESSLCKRTVAHWSAALARALAREG